MSSRIIAVLIFLLTTIGFVAIAQDDAPAPERQLTATQLVVDMTETAQVNQTPIPFTATSEQFAQTATALIIFSSQTSQASGTLDVTQAPTSDIFALTATQIIVDATQTGEAIITAQSDNDTSEFDSMSPLILTIMMVLVLIIILVAIGSAFAYMNTRQTPKK